MASRAIWYSPISISRISISRTLDISNRFWGPLVYFLSLSPLDISNSRYLEQILRSLGCSRYRESTVVIFPLKRLHSEEIFGKPDPIWVSEKSVIPAICHRQDPNNLLSHQSNLKYGLSAMVSFQLIWGNFFRKQLWTYSIILKYAKLQTRLGKCKVQVLNYWITYLNF